MDDAMLSILTEEDIRDLFEEAGFGKAEDHGVIILAEELYRCKELRDNVRPVTNSD